MADDNSTEKPKRVMSVHEIRNLAQRLAARARSLFGIDDEEQRRDLDSAAKVIAALLRNVNPSDVIEIENGNGA